MKIIDVINQTAELLCLVEEKSILATATEDNEAQILENNEINTLFNLFKYSIQELCSNYMPIATSVNVEVKNKHYDICNLHNYLRVQSVNKNDQPVNYKILNRSIVLEEDGEHTIQYTTYPEVISMFDEIDFLSSLSPDVLVFGLASYYTLSRGRFDEFEIFHNEYIEKAESVKELKNFYMPQRRWE